MVRGSKEADKDLGKKIINVKDSKEERISYAIQELFSQKKKLAMGRTTRQDYRRLQETTHGKEEDRQHEEDDGGQECRTFEIAIKKSFTTKVAL